VILLRIPAATKFTISQFIHTKISGEKELKGNDGMNFGMDYMLRYFPTKFI
jgi:hypothetical protein